MQPEFDVLSMVVKAVDDETDPNGEFEAILSTETVDRAGEAIIARAFEPLPESIPVYHQHDWRTGALPVAKAVPFYDGDVLKARGTFASTERGQELRALVREEILGSMSVGFIRQKAAKIDKKPVVTKGELFEASFTGIPMNTDARVLVAKALLDVDVKAGARNSRSDAERLQNIHDYAVENGAMCATAKAAPVEGLTITAPTGTATYTFTAGSANTTATEAVNDDKKSLLPETADAAAATDEVAAAADEDARERLRLNARFRQLPPI